MSKKELFHFTVGQLIEILKSLPQYLRRWGQGVEKASRL